MEKGPARMKQSVTTSAKSAGSRRIDALDVLKGIMIFCLVIFHAPDYHRGFPRLLSPLYNYGGEIGNAFFFMVSGFTMCYASPHGPKEKNILRFAWNRVRKVYLLWLLSDLSVLAIRLYVEGRGIWNIRDFIWNLLMMTSGWIVDIHPYCVPLWFFSTLLLMYLLWFLLARYLHPCRRYLFALMAVIGILLLYAPPDRPFLYFHNGEAMLPFFLGCLLYEAGTQEKIIKTVHILSGLLTAVILTLFVIGPRYGFTADAILRRIALSFALLPLILLSVLRIKQVAEIFSGRILRAVFASVNKYIFFLMGPFTSILWGWIYRRIASRNLSNEQSLIGYILSLYLFCRLFMSAEKRLKTKLFSNHSSTASRP